MTTTYRIKGTVTDVTACNCCGRRGLRKTIALAPLDLDGAEGDVEYYGTSCAATLLGKTNQAITTAAKHADTKAEIDRHWAMDRARRILRTFEPVENAPIRERAAIWRDSNLRAAGAFTTVTDDINRMLTEARELLAA